MDGLIRFSGLVRKGLRFRRKFEDAKRLVSTPDFEWYPYDCFANLFYVQRLLNASGLSLEAVAGAKPVLDLGAADGALSFFLESLGYQVHAVDYAGTNLNRMAGIRSLALALRSGIHIHDIDLDARFEFAEECGAALFLGTLYHMKNPFYILELLAKRMRFCFLSTRVARLSADKQVRLEQAPIAFLLEPDAYNCDVTNYWIFSPAGLRLLVKRAGWTILATANSGARESDPLTKEGDERMFLLLRSNLL
jgi:tRNA (mo5U34)-methyltransferase